MNLAKLNEPTIPLCFSVSFYLALVARNVTFTIYAMVASIRMPINISFSIVCVCVCVWDLFLLCFIARRCV